MNFLNTKFIFANCVFTLESPDVETFASESLNKIFQEIQVIVPSPIRSFQSWYFFMLSHMYCNGSHGY